MSDTKSPAQSQLDAFANQFAIAVLRKIPELLLSVPELNTYRPEPGTVLPLVKKTIQTLPDGGQDLILELLASTILLDIPENTNDVKLVTYDYPLRRETLRILVELVYQPLPNVGE
jgi:hypothetical protein